MTPNSILALDLATRTGWALWSPGALPEYGSIVFPGTGTGTGLFFAGYADWLTGHIEQGTGHVIFEGPIKPGPLSALQATRKTFGLIGITEGICHASDIRCDEANNTKWRSHFFGKGAGRRGALKQLCIEECRARGFAPKNDDEADALGILDYAAHVLQIPTDWPDRGLLGVVA